MNTEQRETNDDDYKYIHHYDLFSLFDAGAKEDEGVYRDEAEGERSRGARLTYRHICPHVVGQFCAVNEVGAPHKIQ